MQPVLDRLGDVLNICQLKKIWYRHKLYIKMNNSITCGLSYEYLNHRRNSNDKQVVSALLYHGLALLTMVQLKKEFGDWEY